MDSRPRLHDARFVVALVATRGRFDLLTSRAVPSIQAQSRLPDRLLVVVDQSKEELTDPALRELRQKLEAQCSPLHVTVMRNRRTSSRAAGAWNSGIDQLHRDARIMAQPDLWFVAILDDDDAWEGDHLELCLDEAVTGDRNMVVAGLVRHESPDDRGHHHATPERLDARELFIRGQHIQGSNLFVRLDLMLMVGGFDEHLPSCTDRDLCLRLASLDCLRFGRVQKHTVHHYADPRPDRLSTPGSAAKHEGLTRFWLKHADRFDAEAQEINAARASELFRWVLAEAAPASMDVPAVVAPREPVEVIAGFVTDARVPEHVAGLLDDMHRLASRPGVAFLKVVVVENGPLPPEGERTLRELTRGFQQRGLDLELITIERQREDWLQGRLVDTPDPNKTRLPIAVSRTVLNTYVAACAEQRPGAWAWILDDDKRLSIRVDRGDGTLVERESPDLASLCALRDAGVHVVIGPDTGAAPLPFVATLRMQMVDLELTLAVLAATSPGDAWPDRTARAVVQCASLKDSYYDLSRFTEHLETPCLMPPAAPGCTAADVLDVVAAKVSRLLAGEAVFRPLSVRADELAVEPESKSVQRGGSTVFFDPQHLREYPQTLARFGNCYVRRSDMLVSQLMRDQLGLRIVKHPAAGVRHDRSATKRALLEGAFLKEDVLGYALYRTADELMLLRSAEQRRTPLLAWNQKELRNAVRLVRKYITERLAAFTLSAWRIHGLAASIREAAKRLLHDGSMWSRSGAAPQVARIVAEMDRIHGQFRPSAVAEFVHRIRKCVSDADIQAAFTSMDGLISEYRATLPTTRKGAAVDAAREARARAILKKAFRTSSLRLLGMGGEGVVFTDEQQVYKVFDLLKRRPNHDTCATLLALRASTDQPTHLYAMTRVEVRDETLLVVYPYEESTPYMGGHGPELLGLLRECKQHGVVFRNMHPKNLRVATSGLKLIDYGSDIRPWSEDGYRSMAERAWLSWRWPHRSDLDELMRRALTDKSLPELVGFENFWTALCDEKPSATRVVAAIVDPIVLGTEALSVLDYGCGKKARTARKLAIAGLRAVGYDPGLGVASRWSELGALPATLTLTASRDDALSLAPFDAVVCSLVLCELPAGSKYEEVLADLRHAVREGGVVVVTVCNPFGTFGGPTPLHRRRDLPRDANYEDRFAYQENAETGIGRTEFHCSLRQFERDLLRHGLRVDKRIESETVDLVRFEPASDFLTLVCRPVQVAHHDRSCDLVIKTCAMEATAIERMVEHVVGQLEGPRVFHERVLAIDSLRDGFIRQHAAADMKALEQAAERLVRRGWIDRVVHGPEGGAASGSVLREWFGIDSTATHTGKGAPLAMPLHAFATCSGDYILQVDSDLLVGRTDAQHDYLGEMIDALEADPQAVTISLNVPRVADAPVTERHEERAWRVEVRGCLLHRRRLLAARPLPNVVENGQPVLSWHRSMDQVIHRGGPRSLRGGSAATWFVHPPNACKQPVADWMLHLDLIEGGRLPPQQLGKVDLVGSTLDWVPRERHEPIIFIITGHNVPPGRMRRCLHSLWAQQRSDWGAVVVDDGSNALSRDYLEFALEPWCNRVTLLQPRERRGQLANTALAIRHVCTDPNSVIVTLDLDDALLGPGVAERVLEEHRRGADVTVGSMLRTDKQVAYPVNFDSPRTGRGGNCWQHLRSFRKRLFDAIPDHELRVDGAYVAVAVDWAFMVPIVEMASRPVWIQEPLYLYEPSGLGKGTARAAREQQIARVLANPPRGWARGKPSSTLVLPERLTADVWGVGGGILFLRHSARPSFVGLTSAEKHAVQITEHGRELALQVGMAVGQDATLVTSPVPRAVETAEAIAQAAGGRAEAILQLRELMEFRVMEPDGYEAVKERVGWTGLMAAWTDGSLPAGILKSCDAVARQAIESTIEGAPNPRVIAVTHDFVIMALLAALRGERILSVPYLAGLFVSMEEAHRFLGAGVTA